MSGNACDEKSASFGKFVGAEIVVIGQLSLSGSMQRFTANAIRVEEATRASSPRFNVQNNRAMRNMVAALDKQTTTVRTADYSVTEQNIEKTPGFFLDRGINFLWWDKFDPEKAIADFTEVLRLNPNLAAAHLYRARALSLSAPMPIGVVNNVLTYFDGDRDLAMRINEQIYRGF